MGIITIIKIFLSSAKINNSLVILDNGGKFFVSSAYRRYSFSEIEESLQIEGNKQM